MDGIRGERQEEDSGGEEGKAEAARADGGLIDDGRTPESGDQEEDSPEDPAGPIKIAKGDEGDGEDLGEAAVEGTGEGVENVAAVELTNGKEIERGGEQADPGGAGYRMEIDVRGGDAGENGLDGEPEERRVAECEVALVGDTRDDLAESEADTEGGQQKDESGEGAGDADIKKIAAGENGCADADEGAEGSDEGGGGEEVGQGGIDAVVEAGEVMAELVGEEDGEEGEGEGETRGEEEGLLPEGEEEVKILVELKGG